VRSLLPSGIPGFPSANHPKIRFIKAGNAEYPPGGRPGIPHGAGPLPGKRRTPHGRRRRKRRSPRGCRSAALPGSHL